LRANQHVAVRRVRSCPTLVAQEAATPECFDHSQILDSGPVNNAINCCRKGSDKRDLRESLEAALEPVQRVDTHPQLPSWLPPVIVELYRSVIA